jgi:hypothetical protein
MVTFDKGFSPRLRAPMTLVVMSGASPCPWLRIIISLWLAVLLIIGVALRNPKTFGPLRLLLSVLGIDTLRSNFFDLYLQWLLCYRDGNWTVVQQGMNKAGAPLPLALGEPEEFRRRIAQRDQRTGPG